MKYFLYILYSRKLDRYYLGISHNPDERLKYHNSFPKGWTVRGRPWELVFTKSFSDRTSARFWELFIKKQKKRVLIEEIISNNFEWNA
ncbi:MAG TPA: GIY-YIG nuclease family protein [Caldithrix abyssi]|uniref:GIY-YIG nuclease family protein n=1 Tax=Caldithrix abyssi TaxID=187145 RepID=A0A7V4WU07_CALAY|nr:GIY-YIG nuclease family protein [Caldithrix abyssi]